VRRLGAAGVALLVGCAHTAHPSPSPGWTEEGDASYYGPGFYGRKTASGEVLRPGTLSAAHPTLPFGTCVQVTVVDTGRSVQVRINDRGPFVAGRVLDVSETAAQALGMVGRGVVRVRLTLCQSTLLEEGAERLASLVPGGACGEDNGCSSPWTPRR
jgi:rare lipoprotein A (peptidoglycan hydrolase)